MQKSRRRLIASLALSSVLTAACITIPSYAEANEYTITAEELKDIVAELLAQMGACCTCQCPYCTKETAADPAEGKTENAAPAVLQIPEQIHVFVDSTQSVAAVLLDASGTEYILSEQERLHADCDGSVARADVYGQSVTLTGVQNGTTTLTLQVQRKNEQNIFETVMTDVDGILVPLETSATVTVD